MKRPYGLSRSELKRSIPYYVLLGPFLLVFIIFMLLPVLSAMVLSFTDFNMVQTPNWVGLTNYVRLFTDDEVFMIALRNTMVYALVTGPVGFILSFVVAWLINELSRGVRTVITLLVYAPSLAGNVYFIWQYLFSSDSAGFLNNLLIQLGIIQDPILWLTDTQYNFGVVMVVIIWLSFGTGFLSFVAGLQALDKTFYEAAALDGLRNRWQELYYVTFPQMGPQLLFGAVMSISSAFSVGYHNKALTGFPSTEYSTHTILLHSMDYADNRYELGYSSAISVVLFAMMILSWVLIQKVLKKFND
ncbi:MAG: sugar ABC transporter permease, partial [Clostridia bacterium]|nr:sugar ABC transporter permease [Clostridia bacterium]